MYQAMHYVVDVPMHVCAKSLVPRCRKQRGERTEEMYQAMKNVLCGRSNYPPTLWKSPDHQEPASHSPAKTDFVSSNPGALSGFHACSEAQAPTIGVRQGL